MIGQQATNLCWQGETHQVVAADPVCQGPVSLDGCAHKTWLAGMMNNMTKRWGIHHWAMKESGRADLLTIGYQSKEWVVCTQRVSLSHIVLSGFARIQVSFSLIKSITSWGLE